MKESKATTLSTLPQIDSIQIIWQINYCFSLFKSYCKRTTFSVIKKSITFSSIVLPVATVSVYFCHVSWRKRAIFKSWVKMFTNFSAQESTWRCLESNVFHENSNFGGKIEIPSTLQYLIPKSSDFEARFGIFYQKSIKAIL